MSEAAQIDIPAPHADVWIVSDDVVDDVAAEIRRQSRDSTLRLTCSVGRLLLDRFYWGDIEAFRRHGRKAVSLRKLVERLRDFGPVSVSSLCRCVAIHHLVQTSREVATSQHLTVSHFVAVLALPPARRVELLQRADQKRWSVRELRGQVGRAHLGLPARGGRPRLPCYLRHVRRLARVADQASESVIDLERVEALRPEEFDELFGALLKVREQCETFQRMLGSRRPRAQGA